MDYADMMKNAIENRKNVFIAGDAWPGKTTDLSSIRTSHSNREFIVEECPELVTTDKDIARAREIINQ